MVVDSSRKNVAIRGLDNELYNEIFSIAKREGKRISDVVNVALKEFVSSSINGYGVNSVNESQVNGKFILKNNGEISLSKNDIIGLKKEVGNFHIENTGHIKFEKDVDKDSIKNIERVMIKDGVIEVPKSLYSNFLIISEINGKLEKY